MSYFARIDSNNVVVQVIRVDQDVIDSGAFGPPEVWIQTSYNTTGGENPYNTPLRMNYAGIGYSYDPVLDAFIPPQPYPSWVLDTSTCWWQAPVPYPTDGQQYTWDEATISWVLVE